MQSDKVYRLIAHNLNARKNCADTMQRYSKELEVPSTARESAANYFNNASEWFDRYTKTIEQLVYDFLPSGSGWDNGTKIDWDHSTDEKIVLYGSFHHMNADGYYDGWTAHTITVRPSLIFSLNLSISGRNRNDIKECLYQMFDSDLQANCYWNEATKRYQRTAPIAVDPFADVPKA